MTSAAALAGAPVPTLVVAGPLAVYVAYKVLSSVYKRYVTLCAMDWTPYAARLMAPLLPAYALTGPAYYKADGVDDHIAKRREAGAKALSKRYDLLTGAEATKLSDALVGGLSDIRFTDTNRVPFQFQRETRAMFRVATIAAKSHGPELVDVDGGRSVDVSGSYGVNVCGYDAYKKMVDKAWSVARDLGPNVLGPIHPVMIDRVLPRLKALSKKEECSFHMSGTEAVMCAVRLARFNTKRKLIVQFAGAYHGWWDGVQPGPGSERANADVLYLKDMSEASLRCIRARSSEIAAVLVSPLQGLNPGKPPPSDLVLLDAKARETAKSKSDYKVWLHRLRRLCSACDVPLVFDEVYTGFRMAPGGAQEYYDVLADVVVYGKTLGGGLACGVVCGPSRLMRRFDPTRPLRVAYVIGTFSAAPVVVAAMAEFLDWLDAARASNLYGALERKTDAFVDDLNETLASKNLPLRLDNLTTVWTVLFKQPGRYHWMYQYYLRAEGLTLSWVGTGRCLVSLDFEDAHFAKVKAAIVNAAHKMKQDGWWDGDVSSKTIKNAITKELLTAVLFGSKPASD
eukprot:CAMPEP_0185712326 /NCGR_PEP_ID=MMETSP1164-20130828/34572_1 /TAXON_ID=1104430 /ORGANISM="Chrysoreinhardia sp, Strain CCMP2950" /LENGTH=567 /DNA_ID=CAMNT_0028379875 /DNA_START=78 /DNA_END=1781 /DNA_ORIENTATION=-